MGFGFLEARRFCVDVAGEVATGTYRSRDEDCFCSCRHTSREIDTVLGSHRVRGLLLVLEMHSELVMAFRVHMHQRLKAVTQPATTRLLPNREETGPRLPSSTGHEMFGMVMRMCVMTARNTPILPSRQARYGIATLLVQVVDLNISYLLTIRDHTT